MKYLIVFLLILLTGCAYKASVEWEWGHESCNRKQQRDDDVRLNCKW